MSEPTSFPNTAFTPHVVKLLQQIDLDEWNNVKHDDVLHFQVATPHSVPRIIECQQEKLPVPQDEKDFAAYWSFLAREEWCYFLEGFFSKTGNVLPYNVSLVFSKKDMDEDVDFSRLRSSAPEGNFCIPNIMELQRYRYNETYEMTPWESRSRVPVWRGTAWIFDDKEHDASKSTVYRALSSPPYRLKAVDWSIQHPSLLDARIGSDLTLNDEIWANSATNGLDRFLPIQPIPPDEYFSQYQVALVLGGKGAAFRTSIHLSTGTAIVLQDYKYKEWFTNMMEPYVHYIPLAEDLRDLETVMVWVRDNPLQVKQIASKGHEFYQTHLSMERNQEHMYEFLYRLSLYQESGQLPANEPLSLPQAMNYLAATDAAEENLATLWWMLLTFQIGLITLIFQCSQRRKRTCKEN